MRAYSDQLSAANIFMDLLNHIGRRGWFMVRGKQLEEEDDSFTYTSFHIHPDDAENVHDLIVKGITLTDTKTTWVLKKQDGYENRFLFYSEELAKKINESMSFNDAVETYEQEPNARFLAAQELLILSDKIYELSLH